MSVFKMVTGEQGPGISEPSVFKGNSHLITNQGWAIPARVEGCTV
jgi:hypothetical protein